MDTWPECNCSKCVDMCKFSPCIPIPQDAERLIEAGYGPRLMASSTIHVKFLLPAVLQYEGRQKSWPVGQCTFLKNDLCELHVLGLKPTEGKGILHNEGLNLDKEILDNQLHDAVIASWDTEWGWRVVWAWKARYFVG